jgi:hypothetical protein
MKWCRTESKGWKFLYNEGFRTKRAVEVDMDRTFAPNGESGRLLMIAALTATPDIQLEVSKQSSPSEW